MDYQKFIDTLPALYEDWMHESVRPKSNDFQEILEKVQGMTKPAVMQMLNWAVECMEPDELYCEIGCYLGSTLIGAMQYHPDKIAYAVDNFSEFDPEGENLKKLTEHIEMFGLRNQVKFHNQGFQDFFLKLRESKATSKKIGVYFYDGAHDYRSQMLGYLLARPFLAERALIVVDDTNDATVQLSIQDFITAEPNCKLLVSLLGGGFWNGIHILSWDTTQNKV
jgi:predicted O-methyltransferase YrrM